MIITAFASVNIWGVLAASVFAFVFGGVYFGVLTTRQYAVAMGREGQTPARPSPLMILGPFLCNVVMIGSIAVLLRLTSTDKLGQGTALGLLVAIGLLLPMCMMIAINPNSPRPCHYTALNAPYLLASAVVYALILTVLN